MAKYITAKELKIVLPSKTETGTEIVPLRKGAVLEFVDGKYTVVKPTNDYERRVYLDESTFNGLKSIKAIVSTEARSALKSATSGNNVDLEKKIITLVTQNNEYKETIEQLNQEIDELKASLSAFTDAATNDGSADENEIPDFDNMTVKQLKEIAAENEVDVTGMNKEAIVEALYALYEAEDEEAE